MRNDWINKFKIAVGAFFVILGTLSAEPGDLVQLTEHISPGGVSNSLVGPGPTSGSQRFYLTYNYEGTTDQSLDLVAVDSTTGSVAVYSAPTPLTGRPERMAYGLTYSTNNKIYLGTMPGAHLLEFSPQEATAQLTDLGNVSLNETHIWALAKSTDGIIYGGTSPNGKLIRFNPTTRKIDDLGTVGDSFLRYIEVSTKGYVYCGTGSTNAKVVVYNTHTGEKRVIVDSGETGYMEVAKRSDGFVWAVTPKTKKAYKLDEFSSTFISNPPSLLPKNRFADGSVISVPADPTKKIVVTKNSVKREFDFTYAGKPRTIFRLATANDGKIFASGILNFNLFSLADLPGTSPTQLGLLGSGEAYSFLPYEDHILIAGYSSNAPLMNYDPNHSISVSETNPNPVLVGKNVIPSDWRPWAMIAGREGTDTVYAAGQPTQGTYGGPLVIWNTVSNAIEVKTPFPDQTISSLVLWGGSLVGGTTINNGVGTTPRVSSSSLFLWDTVEKNVIYQCTLPGKQVNDLQVVTKSGLTSIYGFVDNRLFVFDPDLKSIVYPDTNRINVVSGNTYQSVALMPDGNVWGLAWEGLFCIDTKRNQVRVAKNNPIPGKRPYGFANKANDIYFAIESKMYRYTIPVNTTPPDTTPPTLSPITMPTTLTTAQTVKILVKASDSEGVASLGFMLDDVTVATRPVSLDSVYSMEWPVSAFYNGIHEWKATAFDGSGNSSSTARVPVTVNIPLPAPDPWAVTSCEELKSKFAVAGAPSLPCEFDFTKFRARDERISHLALYGYNDTVLLNAGGSWAVGSASEMNALPLLVPGDQVILKDGDWIDQAIEMPYMKGTRAHPIVIRPQTPGGVRLKGTSRLKVSGENVIIDDLQFVDGGPSDPGTPMSVLQLGFDDHPCEDCVVNHVTIENYNSATGTESTPITYLSIAGENPTVANSKFMNKRNAGPMVVAGAGGSKGLHLLNNEFLGRPAVAGLTGPELLLVGDASVPTERSYALIADNVFQESVGGNETVSVRVSDVILQGNRFNNNQGPLRLQSGNRALVLVNDFDGGPGMGGIRVSGAGHWIAGNRVANLSNPATAFNWPVSLAMGNGENVAQVKNVVIAGNSFEDVEKGVAVGVDETGTHYPLAPENVYVLKNQFMFQSPAHTVSQVKSYKPVTKFNGDLAQINKVANQKSLIDIAQAQSILAIAQAPPTVPTITTVIGKDQSMDLGWTRSTSDWGGGLKQYRVDVSTQETFVPCVEGWNGTSVGVQTSTTVTGLAVGMTYYARVRGEDWAGDVSHSSPRVSAKTLADETSPSIGFTNPEPGTTITTPQTVAVTADARDNVAVSTVQFILNGVTVAEDITPPYIYYWPLTASKNGQYEWSAKAIDSAGNSVTMTAVPVTVSIDATHDPFTYQHLEVKLLTPGNETVQVHLMTGDLSTGHLKIGTRMGEVPTKTGIVESQLVEPQELSAGFVGTINANSFRTSNDDQGYDDANKYEVGRKADILGFAMEKGVLRSPSDKSYVSLWGDSHGVISTGTPSGVIPSDAWGVAGSELILWHGDVNSQREDDPRAPRTAMGWDASGKVIWLLVADGGQAQSAGMKMRELGDLLKSLGAWNAIALDGGGSSVLHFDSGSGIDRMNVPSDLVARGLIRPLPMVVGFINRDTEAPPIPTLIATGLESAIRLDWSAVTDDATGGSGLSHYIVRVSTTETFIPCLAGWDHQEFSDTVLSTTIGNLAHNTTYYAQIKSIDVAGNTSDYSVYASSKVLTDRTKPTFTAMPTVEGLEGKLKVEWQTAVDTGGSGLRYYHIYVSSVPNSPPFVYSKTSLAVTLSSVTLSTTTFRAETTYYVRMRAQDNAGNLSMYTSTVSATTLPDTTNPDRPASLTVIPKYKGIDLSWPLAIDSGGSGVAGYRVDVSSYSNFSNRLSGWDKRNMVTLSTSVVSLTANKMYYARVWTVDGAGNESPTAIAGSTKTLSTQSLRAHGLGDDELPTAPDTVNGARAYPVPFRPGIGATGITFDRIPAETAVRIYTIDGRPVKTLTTNTGGSVLWDLTNDNNNQVASGVYLAIIEKDGNKKRFRVVVQK